MTTPRRIGTVIAVSIVIGAATGLILGLLRVNPTVAAATVGVVIGICIARGVFSAVPDEVKRNRVK